MRIQAIKSLWQEAPADLRETFRLRNDHSFDIPVTRLIAQKA